MLILCCVLSRSMSANVLDGPCYSNLPASSYTATTGCQRVVDADVSTQTVTFTWDGQAITGTNYVVQSPTSGNGIISMSTTLPASDMDRYTGLTQAPAITLIHKAEDLARTTAAPPSSTSTSLAAGLRLNADHGVIGVVLGLWTLLGVV
jgi:hypothetical protein